jgi:hypothetical protein
MKRILLALLTCLGLAHSAQAAIAVGVHAKNSATSGTTVVTAGVTTQASGSVFFVTACTTGTYAVTPITDSKSNTYSVIQSWTTTWGTTKCVRAQVTNGTGGASHTFTATTTGSAISGIWALEITGALTASAIDQSNKGNDAATPFDSPNTGTLGQAAEILIGFASDNSSSGTCTYGAGNSFTLLDTITNATSGITGANAWKVVAATTADHSSFTDTGCGATQMDVSIDTFKQSGGAVTCAPTLTLMGVGRCG